MHILCVFWKILFACIPPTEYWNGWACFIVSIFVIGFLTAIIGDLASHFGCTVGLRDTVTAVVFVALGTSLPGKWFLRSPFHICTPEELIIWPNRVPLDDILRKPELQCTCERGSSESFPVMRFISQKVYSRSFQPSNIALYFRYLCQ